MSHAIDFLPTSYREAQKHQRELLCWRGIALITLVLVSIATVREYRQLTALKDDRRRTQDRLQALSAPLEDGKHLAERLQRIQQTADLVALLRLQARPTPIIAAVTNSLPQFVKLTKLEALHQPDEQPASGGRATRQFDVAEATPGPDPVAVDLEALWQHQERRTLVLSLDGIAPNDVAISKYLAALQETGLFSSVELISAERYHYRTQDDEYRLRKFGIRLLVKRPGSIPDRPSADLGRHQS